MGCGPGRAAASAVLWTARRRAQLTEAAARQLRALERREGKEGEPAADEAEAEALTQRLADLAVERAALLRQLERHQEDLLKLTVKPTIVVTSD